MGCGDELIAAGQARRLRERDPRRVRINDDRGGWRRHAIWDGNPHIARPGERGDFQILVNARNSRPYVERFNDERWVWREYRCTPGDLFLSEGERRLARRWSGVVIEPHIKSSASPNKQWGWERWQALVDACRGIRFLQLGPPATRLLRGVRHVVTPDFRHAAAVLERADAYVGPEGGMHHAAAALGVPAVVLFGGFISPAQTGYAGHINLFTGEEPCGMRIPCNHCDSAMARISVDLVAEKLREVLNAELSRSVAP